MKYNIPRIAKAWVESINGLSMTLDMNYQKYNNDSLNLETTFIIY